MEPGEESRKISKGGNISAGSGFRRVCTAARGEVCQQRIPYTRRILLGLQIGKVGKCHLAGVTHYPTSCGKHSKNFSQGIRVMMNRCIS